MPLVLDPSRHSAGELRALLADLRGELTEARELIDHPRGAVPDPSGLTNAAELLGATLAYLDDGDDSNPAELVRKANLAYATLVAVIDLVKSHTDAPRVPRPRTPSPGPQE
jgi:hypothetical protein